VWLAALRADPQRSRPFSDYALLGDDIVIGDELVAHHYQALLSDLSVSISIPKSLISNNGVLEFAKQFWVQDRNLSPVSIKALLVTQSLIGVTALGLKWNLSYKTMVRLAGGGYRVLAHVEKPKSLKWRRMKVIADKMVWSKLDDLEMWLGGGIPLNPYIKGIIIRLIQDKMKPRQLSVPPCPEIVFDGEAAILEYTLYHGWMNQWLKYCSWYYSLLLTPELTIRNLEMAPVIATSWKINSFDSDIFRFGFLWTCFPISHGVEIPLSLPEPEFPGWLRGGLEGNAFLMKV